MKRFVIAFLSILSMVRADCFNFKRDGSEAGVDCGGPDCFQRCELGSCAPMALTAIRILHATSLCGHRESGGPTVDRAPRLCQVPKQSPKRFAIANYVTIILVGLGLSCFGIYYIMHFGENSIRSISRLKAPEIHMTSVRQTLR